MKQIKNKLNVKVWGYLFFFSLFILAFLCFFQVVSLKSYYEWRVKGDIKTIVNNVKENINDSNYSNYLNKISFQNNMCIEIYENGKREFSSISCNIKMAQNEREKNGFMNSNENMRMYEIQDRVFNSKMLLNCLKMDDEKYIFVTASLLPVEAASSILKEQLLIVLALVLILSVIVSIFISRKISKPIVEISKNAKLIASGNYNVNLDDKSTVDEIRELNETLSYTSLELSKTETLRKELLANVSHDLKTPLTMIKAYAEMVRDLTYKNKKKREENLNVIIKEADRLNILVNDILDLSKYQANTINLEYSSFDIDLLIKDIIDRYEVYKINNGYDIKYEKELDGVIVNADKKRIEQVIYNLLNNALNYTGDDKKVTVKLIDCKDYVRVEVIDTGKGIKKDELPLIFDKYYKVDKTYSRMQIGTGIGLSIVRDILKLHNVKYGVESKVGCGSTFYFELKKN